MRIFDRTRVKQHRNRAARNFNDFAFLLEHAAEYLADRLEDTTRQFPLALELGCHNGLLRRFLPQQSGIKTLIQCDLSPEMVRQAGAEGGGIALAADEEFLPFAGEMFDLALSVLSLHWVNDLPGCLLQLRRALKKNGIMLASMLGGETLQELRQVMMAVETEYGSGVSAHISPMIEVKDAGALLQRAGFAMPVADSERVTVTYAHLADIFRDLRGMGETSALVKHAPFALCRPLLGKMEEYYRQHFADEEGRLKVTFDIVTVTGMA